jgi:hypothetical protein
LPEIQAAIQGGLWTNIEVTRYLVDLADSKNIEGVDIDKVRDELFKANEGSPRYRRLRMQLEKYYQRMHGA